MSEQIHNLRVALINALDKCGLPRGVLLKTIDQCRSQLENRTLVEGAVATSGYNVSGFHWNDQLELHFDITRDGQDVGWIAKGWGDPGYRINNIITIPPDRLEQFEARSEEVHKFCATNGFISTFSTTPDGCEVILEYVIYSTGFDARTLSQSLSSLAVCSRSVQG